MDKLGLKIRTDVLSTALIVEHLTSAFLSELLGIEDFENSSVLGNKGGCLSFNQKINVLIEMKALERDARNKFQAFMEMRNQFMHNYEATTYEKCFSFTGGTDKYLLRIYPQLSSLNREEQLRLAANQLGADVLKLTIRLIDKVNEQVDKDIEVGIIKKSHQAFVKTIEQAVVGLNSDPFNKEIEKGAVFNATSLKDFGIGIIILVCKLWEKNFELLNNNEE